MMMDDDNNFLNTPFGKLYGQSNSIYNRFCHLFSTVMCGYTTVTCCPLSAGVGAWIEPVIGGEIGVGACPGTEEDDDD
jgi:hypothetical protein